MKIALIGAHGTGKTTLAHELVSSLKKQDINAGFLGELIRSCPFPINQDQNIKTSEWTIYGQYLKELEMEEKCDILVCDRSVIDGYVYSVNMLGRNSLLENFVRAKSSSYSLLIRVPMNPLYLKDDNFRSLDLDFQKAIDEKFNEVLRMLSIHPVNYSSTNEITKYIARDLCKRKLPGMK